VTIYDYFERACRRPLAPVAGEPIRDDEGNCAAFSIGFADGRVATVSYRCTTCATLIALCEHLSELVTGLDAASVLRMKPEVLLVLHPEVPESKRAAAAIALKALQNALQRS
jgi:hypothetical protein